MTILRPKPEIELTDKEKEQPNQADELGKSGAPSRTRTCNRRIRSPMLYPLSHGRTWRAIEWSG